MPGILDGSVARHGVASLGRRSNGRVTGQRLRSGCHASGPSTVSNVEVPGCSGDMLVASVRTGSGHLFRPTVGFSPPLTRVDAGDPLPGSGGVAQQFGTPLEPVLARAIA